MGDSKKEKAKEEETAKAKVASKKTKSKKAVIIKLIIALVIVIGGGVLFVGAVSGWFSDTKVTLDEEYYGEGATFMELTTEDYNELVDAGKSFVVFVDQGGCTTADRLREYMTQYMAESGILVYRMMFSDAKESSLHDQVKYYPSVAVISKGKVVRWLRADNDEDAPIYNNYEEFAKWMGKTLKTS